MHRALGVRLDSSRRGSLVLISALLVTLITSLFSAGLATTAAAATPTYIQGTLVDSEKEPISGVTISATGANGFSGEAISDASGKWKIEVPAAAVYEVTINQEQLPSGQALTDAAKATIKANVISLGFDVTILFPIGPGVEKTTNLERSAQLLADGLILALVIALAALGLNLVFGTTGLTNFAHGELLTLGGLLTYYLSAIVGLKVIFAIPLAIILAGFIGGYLQDKFLWQPLRRRGTGLIAALIVSIGLAILIRYFFLFIFGGDTRQLPEYAGQPGLSLGLVSITPKSIITSSIGLAMLVVATLWLSRSHMGKASRAVADNPALASSSGIEVERVIRAVWILGATLAAFAGIMVTVNQGVSFVMGQDLLLLIFAAVTLGGLGTINGALVGSLVIGVSIQLSTLFIPTELKYVGALVILILILLVRPQGILGKKGRIG
ncbi:MAG: branched-chain amino acid ABC transporter permease [Candidatus Nanopelagicaceae bacterium]|jgi:neutral amino acid transport system permease protein